jgi:hypothetical protein
VGTFEGVQRRRGQPLERGDLGIGISGTRRGDRRQARLVETRRRRLLDELGELEQHWHDRRRYRRLLRLARHD